MLNFEKAIEIAITELSKFNKIEEISDLGKYGYEKKYSKVWKVISEVEPEPNHSVECEFHICFKSDFPLSIPWIYLAESDYKRYRYVPHLDNDRMICTFNRQTLWVDTERPATIVQECLRRAKRTMSLGLQGKNKEDYKNEYLAYWNQKYNDENKNESCLSLINHSSADPAKLNLIEILSKDLPYTSVLHQKDNLYHRFIAYLKQKKIFYKEHNVWYCANLLKENPPFDLTHGELLKTIETLGLQVVEQLSEYLQKNMKYPVIVSSVIHNNTLVYVGYKLDEIKCKRNGFNRTGSLSPVETLNTFLKRKPVARLSFEDITPSRIYFRSSGMRVIPKLFKLSIVGLGSIGSNLLYYLNSLPVERYALVDNEVLEIENMGRHFFGFSFVNEWKVQSLKSFIQDKNPLIEVEVHKCSIVEIVKKQPKYVNDSDYIFFALGNENIEWWLKENISESVITKPCFFIWVEPYLCGGHCLYIHPENKDKWRDYFDESGCYKFNVISKLEYEKSNPKLSKNEAGCQTYFTPYAATDITKFLSMIFPIITNTMYEESKETAAYTWYGCREILETERIAISGDAIDATAGNVRRR